MGMAASQARLLSITSRMADNELRAQLVNNSKMRLATESSKVSENYISALNDATMMMTNYDTSGNSQYQALTFNSLTAYSSYNNQYALINNNGQIFVTESEDSKFKEAIAAGEGKYEASLNAYLEAHDLKYGTNYFAKDGILSKETSTVIEQSSGLTLKTDGNGNVIFTDGAKTEETTYATFTIDELRKMYEGEEPYTSSYETVSNSTSYETFLDLFNTYQANKKVFEKSDAYSKAISAMKETISKAAYNNVETLPDFKKNGGTANKLYQNLINISNNPANYLGNYYGSESENTVINKLKKSLNEIIVGNDFITVEDDCDAITINNGKGTIDGTSITFEDSNAKGTFIGGSLFVDDQNNLFIMKESNNNKYEKIDSKTPDGFTQKNDYTYAYDESNKAIYEMSKNSGEYTVTAYSWDGTTATKQSFITYTKDGNKYNTEENYYDQNIILDSLDSYVQYLRDNVTSLMDIDGYVQNNNSSDKTYKAYKESKEKLIDFLFKTGQDTDINEDNLKNIVQIYKDYPNAHTTDFEMAYQAYILNSVLDVFGEPTYGWVDESGVEPDENAEAKVRWYTNQFDKMWNSGYSVLENGLASSNDWIRFALESGLATMQQVDTNDLWQGILYSNCSEITEVTDNAAVAKAEAEYNRQMNNIEAKDQRFDVELKNIDTEHSSLQTEYDSVKSVISKNIERAFKMYS